MHNVAENSKLCRLIDESLRPFAHLQEELAVCLTKESEKGLLIVLSQIFRQIQLWIQEFDSDSKDNVTVVKAAASNRKCSAGLKPYCTDHDCLTKLIGDLIRFLSFENQFVQHLAGNILVAISDYMVASEGSNWDEFMQSLCACLDLEISSALLHSLERPTTEVLVSNLDSSSATISLTSKLKKANWSSVACVVRGFRNILKHLKQVVDDQLLGLYLDSISSWLPTVPWNALDQLHSDKDCEALKLSDGNASYPKVGLLDSRLLLRGTLVQIFCSLVNQSVWTAGVSLNKHPVICEINNLIPRLLAQCLVDGDRNNMCMSEYFRHKMLMLMIRLSFQLHLDYSLLVSWLHLIRKYFDDLLLLPMTQLVSDHDSLDGSPFIPSVSDVGMFSMTSCHLRRLAVFLFLRCSLCLVSMRAKTTEECHCANMKRCMTSDLECCSTKKGLSEIYWWLQENLPAKMFVMCEFYYDRCTNFLLSFVRLFIHEDDILFEVLLQLLRVPLFAKQQISQDKCNFEEMKDDMLFHVSNLFDPVILFHVFLAELHYDHEVLLDYLISKDTGANSAEYLLRSLRVVCDSWNGFVEFSIERNIMDTEKIYKSSAKKSKVLEDVSDILGHLTSSSVKSNGKRRLKGLMNDSKHCRKKKLPFEKAKDCLLSLKKSVQNLRKKHLFPYNPEVLLQRLTRFQELCLEG